MATLRIKRWTGGIDRSVQPFELEDGQFVTMRNLLPQGEVVRARPGQTQYLSSIAEVASQGLYRYYSAKGSEGSTEVAGPFMPRAVRVDTSSGSRPWSNIYAITAHDGNFAESWHRGDTAYSYILVAHDFGVSLPEGARVTGIKFETVARSRGDHEAAYAYDHMAKLVKAGQIVGTNHARGWEFIPPRNWETKSYGGQGDLWGVGLTRADVMNPQFGFALQVTLSGWRPFLSEIGSTYDLDVVRLFVYYFDPSTSMPTAPNKETLILVGGDLYSDRDGSTWTRINPEPMSSTGKLAVVTWKGKAFIQDGETGPWVYDRENLSFSRWGEESANPPPVAKYMILDQERLYAAGIKDRPSAVQASTLNDENDWPFVAKPGGDEGMIMFVGKDEGDFITSFVRFGDWKIVGKRRSIWGLAGHGADSWRLQYLFPVGCVAHGTMQNCGVALCWTDGRRVYAFDGSALHADFGKPVEKIIAEADDAEWDRMHALYWDGLYMLWYKHDRLVVYDFRSRSWFGPWEGVYASAAVVDRDENIPWLAHSARGSVTRLVGENDFGAREIEWELETKHYDFGMDGYVKRARRISVITDMRNTIALYVIADAEKELPRWVVGANELRTARMPLTPPLDGERLAIRIRGSGTGGIYEVALEAQPVRKVV